MGAVPSDGFLQKPYSISSENIYNVLICFRKKTINRLAPRERSCNPSYICILKEIRLQRIHSSHAAAKSSAVMAKIGNDSCKTNNKI